MPAVAIGAIATVGSAAMQSSAASSAARSQRRAAQAATEAELSMYNQTREDQAPFREAGYAGLNRLQYLLGLGGTSGDLGDRPTIQTEAELRAALSPQYTKFQNGVYGGRVGLDESYFDPTQIGYQVDEAGLKAAIAKTIADQTAAQKAYDQRLSANQLAARRDPQFGSLLRQFTGKDLANDPGYQFRLGEGMKALDRSASARGGMYSGAQLKGLNRYNQDYASNEFTNAFNRDQAQKSQTFNMLSGISGTGQTATNQVAQQGAMVANNIGSNLIGAGNARATSYLAQGNALTNALNQGVSMWNNRPQQSSTPTWAAPSYHSSEWWRGGDGYYGE